jgi:hypothetical protein
MIYIKAKGIGWYECDLGSGMIESLTLSRYSTSIAQRNRSISGNNLATWRKISQAQYMKVRAKILEKLLK